MNNYPSRIFRILLIAILVFTACQIRRDESTAPGPQFTFAFLTDIHLEPERNAIQGFQVAINKVNSLNPDFVITGGDLIFDGLGVKESRADSLFDLYISAIRGLKPPFYNTSGNHDFFGVYKESRVAMNHKFFGIKMYEAKLGKAYYSFDHKGWKFFVLKSVQVTPDRQYTGEIDSLQIEWLKKELAQTDKSAPLVIVTHIPFITSYSQLRDGSMAGNPAGLVVSNSKQVLNLFEGYNLRLVLQGHLHLVEDIYAKGIHFITGGAVSANWWLGPLNGMKEGFMMMTMAPESVQWRYTDFGWVAHK